MGFSIVCENEYLDIAENLAANLNANICSFESELDNNVIIIFETRLGRYSYQVEMLLDRLYDKNVSILCYGNTGFDVGRIFKNRLSKQGSVLVYSKYFKKLDTKKVSDDLLARRVETDGNSFNEKVIGAICRLFFGVNI